MIRLTVTLIVAIYIVLIVIPGADHGTEDGRMVDVGRGSGQNWLDAVVTDAELNAQSPRRAPPSARAVQGNPLDRLIESADGYVLETADGERLEISVVIDPVELLAQAQAGGDAIAGVTVAVDVTPDRVAMAQPVTAEASAALPALWRVSGDSVNFRAGPSTDTAILTSLVRGDAVVYLADAADDWAYLRVVSSGLEGYMAARFLEPVN